MSWSRLSTVSMLLIGLAACSSDPSSPVAPTPPGPAAAVAIPVGAAALTTRAYNPEVVDIAVGTTVTWANNDGVPHTTTADAGAWNSGSVAAGRAFSLTFQNAGTFAYHCTIHPGMVGTVVVR